MSSPVQKTIQRDPATPLSTNVHLLNWVEKMANLTKPAAVHWVDGSVEEDEMLKAQMVEAGTFIKLNEELWPGCYYAVTVGAKLSNGSPDFQCLQGLGP